jgi:hypothetical protein
MIKVLYDGAPLIYNPNSPPALHLLALLEQQPEGIESIVALPSNPAGWLSLESAFEVFPTPSTPAGRLQWEQIRLAQIFRKIGADLVHHTSSSPPLSIASSGLFSPAGLIEWPNHKSSDSLSRLRRAAHQGSLSQARAILWPEDIPVTLPGHSILIERLPQTVWSGFFRPPGTQVSDPPAELPESYVLYHGPDSMAALQALM